MVDGGHQIGLLALYALALVLYIAEIIFGALSGAGNDALFTSSQKNLSDLFHLDITPADWTFSIWGFIYTWQALWMVYAFTLLFRRGKTGYLYVSPRVLPVGFLLAFCLSCAGVITWLFLWDRRHVDIALGAILVTAVSLHVAQAFGYRQLSRIETILVDQGLTKDVWVMRILVLNGLAFYTTWVSIASCLNIGVVLAYTGANPLPTSAASTAALAVLMAVIFLWFILKTFISERQLRYILSPFIVLFVALAGSITENWDRKKGNSIFTAAIIALVSLLFFITIIRVIVRQLRDNKRQLAESISDPKFS